MSNTVLLPSERPIYINSRTQSDMLFPCSGYEVIQTGEHLKGNKWFDGFHTNNFFCMKNCVVHSESLAIDLLLI